MLYMNDYDISRALSVLKEEAPELAPFAQYLSDWQDVVNSNSDGWAHWKVGPKAAAGLMAQINRAVESITRGRGDDLPSAAQMKKTLTPIKSACTRYKLTPPNLRDAPSPGPRL